MKNKLDKTRNLQTFLEAKFKCWKPEPPTVLERTKYSITMDWQQGDPFGFLGDQLLYKVELKGKMPLWVVVYSGGKTTKMIDNLAPRYPHKFRLRVILKATGVPQLAAKALEYYGDENTVYEKIKNINNEVSKTEKSNNDVSKMEKSDSDVSKMEKSNNDVSKMEKIYHKISETDNNDNEFLTIENYDKEISNADGIVNENRVVSKYADEKKGRYKVSRFDYNKTWWGHFRTECKKPWLESSWSEETWTSTDTDGSSNVCFCMAVRCGYIKQVLIMLEERPELIGIVNSTNGFTPLAIAVRKGDMNLVRCLLSSGAEIDQRSTSGQTALHLAVITQNLAMVELLLDSGADFEARDMNDMRVEHYAVDCGNLDLLKYILDRGDVHVQDNNGWTPLFRALCQGAKTEVIEELVMRGSDVDMSDHAGLPLTSVARLLSNRHGRERDSVLRLVDRQYPHEKALANFTRLTKKIYHVQTVLK